jgi:hypothetical protein
MQKSGFSWLVVKWVTLTLLASHTVYVVFVFLFVHTHREAQDVLWWLYFFRNADEPLVTLGFTLDREALSFTGRLTQWWYDMGHQGLNLRAAIIYLIFGGLQWSIIGFATGCVASGVRALRTRRLQKSTA